MASVAQPPHGLHETVKALLKEKNPEPTDQTNEEHPQTPPLARNDLYEGQHERNASVATQASKPRTSRHSSHVPRWSVSTPSARTGPPTSIPYNYSVSSSHPASRTNSHDEHDNQPRINLPSPTAENWEESDFAPINSPFRGALEYSDPEQREKEREIAEKRNRRRESFSYFHDVFNPNRWTSDSPREDHSPFHLGRRQSGHQGEETSSPAPGSPVAPSSPPGSPVVGSPETRHARIGSVQSPPSSSATSPRLGNAGRSRSLPHFKQESKPGSTPKWNRLRSLLPSIAAQGREQAPGPSTVVPQSVNITDELIAGGLSTLLLRLWFERDEKDQRRVPVLFHHLRIRVSDSLHPLHGNKAVFRIECEYANGAARWVVYRQLREFLSLHTHYTISNAYNRNVDTLPDFPRAGTYILSTYTSSLHISLRVALLQFPEGKKQ